MYPQLVLNQVLQFILVSYTHVLPCIRKRAFDVINTFEIHFDLNWPVHTYLYNMRG